VLDAARSGRTGGNIIAVDEIRSRTAAAGEDVLLGVSTGRIRINGVVARK
jgi:hypothetical protein